MQAQEAKKNIKILKTQKEEVVKKSLLQKNSVDTRQKT